jgi:hypothetical protein
MANKPIGDFRNALARERTEWLESAYGQRCCEGTASGQYLRTLLEVAFIAGWEAKKKQGAKDE